MPDLTAPRGTLARRLLAFLAVLASGLDPGLRRALRGVGRLWRGVLPRALVMPGALVMPATSAGWPTGAPVRPVRGPRHGECPTTWVGMVGAADGRTAPGPAMSGHVRFVRARPGGARRAGGAGVYARTHARACISNLRF